MSTMITGVVVAISARMNGLAFSILAGLIVYLVRKPWLGTSTQSFSNSEKRQGTMRLWASTQAMLESGVWVSLILLEPMFGPL